MISPDGNPVWRSAIDQIYLHNNNIYQIFDANKSEIFDLGATIMNMQVTQKVAQQIIIYSGSESQKVSSFQINHKPAIACSIFKKLRLISVSQSSSGWI